MKIEVLEDKLKSTDPETGQHYSLETGDRVTVSDEAGRRWCDAGWVKDLSGAYPTGERVVQGATVKAHNAEHKMKEARNV